MMMKKVIYFILMLAAITVCGNIAEAQSKFTKGKISGIVIDKSSGSPLENATVQLFRMKDSSLVTGGATEASGTFLIENIPGGRYNVLISFIGYNNINAKNIAINSKSPEVDLGTLKMSTSNDFTTEEIEVTSEKPLMEMDFDKKVYNVEKNLVTQSGTATDVLKNIPSVSVDADGNVSVRGSSNVRILINGKPSSLLGGQDNNVLDQIPSDNIEKVEVINNPSARYDAEGDVGIINIVLKQ
ncbi:MAG TPA: TonB-dependent receptor, partial [Ignavibacteria bacterium]|nr:TonB-dependent receptor [Ignavibacteria bacterium]